MPIQASTLRALALKAVRTLGQVNTAVIYQSVVTGLYDPDAGTTADVITAFPMTVPVLRGDDDEKSNSEANKNIQRVIVPYAFLQGRGITPGPQDFFTIAGVRWEITRIKTVPTGAITTFFVETP